MNGANNGLLTAAGVQRLKGVDEDDAAPDFDSLNVADVVDSLDPPGGHVGIRESGTGAEAHRMGSNVTDAGDENNFISERPRPDSTRILVVDDDQAFRHSVSSMAGMGEVPKVVAGADSLSGARRRLAVGAFDLAVIAARLPDGSAAHLFNDLADSRPGTPMTVVAVFGDKARVLAALEAASTAWAQSSETAIEQSAARAAYGLSDREIQVLQYIAKGLSVSEVSQYMALSKHTIATHLKHIYKKMGVGSRASCIYEAMRSGLSN